MTREPIAVSEDTSRGDAANTVGAAIPIIAQKLRIDPTVVSAPLITTLVDALGLFIYFTVTHLTIAQLH